MARIDVGGNRAGTQTGYTAYGFSGQVRVLIEGINTTEGTGGAGFYFDYCVARRSVPRHVGPVGGDAEPRRAEPVHRASRAATSSTASTTWTGTTTRCRARTSPATYTAPTAFNNSADSRRTATRSTLLRHAHQRRRPDQEGQDVVVRHLPQAVQRRGAAELPVRQDLRHQAVERGRQGHLSAEPEQQAHRLLPVGPEDCSRTACRSAPTSTTSPEPTYKQDSGQLGLQGRVERHAQQQAVRRRRATATSATTSRCSPTATTTTSGATRARWRSKARTGSGSSIATASS